jgi:hypothetical protein
MNSTLGQNNDCSRNGVSNTDKNLFSTLQDNDNKGSCRRKINGQQRLFSKNGNGCFANHQFIQRTNLWNVFTT